MSGFNDPRESIAGPLLKTPSLLSGKLAVNGEVPMHKGVHEALVTREVERELAREFDLTATLAGVDEADQSHVLARHLAGVLQRRLEGLRDPAKRLALANELLTTSRPSMTPSSTLCVNYIHCFHHAARESTQGTAHARARHSTTQRC